MNFNVNSDHTSANYSKKATTLFFTNIDLQEQVKFQGNIKPHQFDMMTQEEMKKAYRILYESDNKKTVMIRRLQKQKSRYRREIGSVRTLLHELQSKELICSGPACIVQVMSL